MNLFIDTISPKNVLILFDDEKNIIHNYFFDVRLQESSRLIEEIDMFLQKYQISYFDIQKIVVVHGPWSFTGVRTTVLLANTLNYVVGGNMFFLSYFDLFTTFPIVKSSSKRDVFFKKDFVSDVEILSHEVLIQRIENEKIPYIFGDVSWDFWVEIYTEVDYKNVLQNLSFAHPQKRIEPLYLKKPNIS